MEAHLLNRQVNSTTDFYGSPLKLCLVGFLRKEQKFNSFDALISQINADIQQSKELSMNFDKGGPLDAGRTIAKDFFNSPMNLKSDNIDIIWERKLIPLT